MKLSIFLPLFLTLPACVAPASIGLAPNADQQALLTPDGVLKELDEGNQRYVEGRLSEPNVAARIAMGTKGQYPKAVVLSCLDSRVPVELVFDQGIGDLFVGRVAGNVENEDQLGSMEFATKLSGVKAVIVLGHQACGAVKGACDGAKMGNLTALLSKIQPALDAVPVVEGEQRNSKNKDFVERVVEANVRQTVADILSRSAVLSELVADGSIKVVGAIYSLETGEVRWL